MLVVEILLCELTLLRDLTYTNFRLSEGQSRVQWRIYPWTLFSFERSAKCALIFISLTSNICGTYLARPQILVHRTSLPVTDQPVPLHSFLDNARSPFSTPKRLLEFSYHAHHIHVSHLLSDCTSFPRPVDRNCFSLPNPPRIAASSYAFPTPRILWA